MLLVVVLVGVLVPRRCRWCRGCLGGAHSVLALLLVLLVVVLVDIRLRRPRLLRRRPEEPAPATATATAASTHSPLLLLLLLLLPRTRRVGVAAKRLAVRVHGGTGELENMVGEDDAEGGGRVVLRVLFGGHRREGVEEMGKVEPALELRLGFGEDEVHLGAREAFVEEGGALAGELGKVRVVQCRRRRALATRAAKRAVVLEDRLGNGGGWNGSGWSEGRVDERSPRRGEIGGGAVRKEDKEGAIARRDGEGKAKGETNVLRAK